MSHDNAPTQYPRLALPLVLLFNLLVLVWWLEFGLRVPALGALRFEFLLAALVSGIALMRHASKRRVPATRARNGGETNADITRWVVAYLVVTALSLPLAIDFQVAWDTFVNRVAKLALLGVLISQFVVSPLTLRFYLFTLLVAFMKIGQEAFLGKITGNMVWENQGVPRLHGTAGTMFGHPNSLSGKTVSTIPFLWYLFPATRHRWIKVMIAIQFVFAINIVIFTASRTGYLTFIAGVLLIVAFSNRKKAPLVLLIAVAAIASAFLVPEEYQERFLSAFTGQEAEGQSSATRKGLLVDSLQTFAQNPLGVGLGGFPIYQAIHGRNVQETHNLYTQILAETGIQGFICFMGLLAVVLRKALGARRAFMRVIDKLEKRLAAPPPHKSAPESELESELGDVRLLFATTNALIVFTFVRLGLGLFGHDLLEIYWWFAAGLAMALHNMRGVAEKRCAELTTPIPTAVAEKA